MKKGSMQGTPWHVEILTKDKEDNRRIKNACQYYRNGKCIKLENTCYGSAKCEFYIENPNYQRSIKKLKTNINQIIITKQNIWLVNLL